MDLVTVGMVSNVNEARLASCDDDTNQIGGHYCE